MYRKSLLLKEALNIHWHGTLDQVLLPIDYQFYDDLAYRSSIKEGPDHERALPCHKKGSG